MPYTTTQLKKEAGIVTDRVVVAAGELPPPTIDEVMELMEPEFDERAISSGVWDAISSGRVKVLGGNTLVQPI